jgi:hypothetical protein
MAHDDEALVDFMCELHFDETTALMLERMMVQPHASQIPRYFVEVARGVKIEPALSHDVMAFLACGNAYGFGGGGTMGTQVKFEAEKEYLTNKAHYYEPVRATTPGGSEFEIFWKDRGAGLDDVRRCHAATLTGSIRTSPSIARRSTRG